MAVHEAGRMRGRGKISPLFVAGEAIPVQMKVGHAHMRGLAAGNSEVEVTAAASVGFGTCP
jgi:hypothetical protein